MPEAKELPSRSLDLRSWLLELARTTMAREGNSDVAHDMDHIARVMALAETIQRREGGDLTIIWAAAALHDIGQERERRQGGDHALIGAQMAAELLSGTPFPQEAIPAVQEAIADHRLTAEQRPRSLEGRVLYDADKLDALGAIGIGRLYMITGRRGQRVYAPLPEDVVLPVSPRYVRELRNRSDYSPSIEFRLLFTDLPEQLCTATGRELARQRYAFMREFFQRLEAEARGEY
ncbi:HD domain-containing protein [Thermogemmatispora sp.]|uniref:HD domain-containing protein n=1 Tax=Thermogemmatispora sp. TaxID=1968838 RepID=UPI001DCB941F|nr:HD domain-containing protein [Thermogemmatispora sp.]MBX5450725.1 HD domain-containing protein [Thermogemmatispora sp.]